LEQQIAEIKRVLATMSNGQGTDQKLRDVYVKTVEEQLPSVLDNLREYTRVMGRMYEKQGKQNAGNISQLVEAQGGSFNFIKYKILIVDDFKILLAMSFIAVLFGLLFGLVKNSVKPRFIKN
jgi:hypothetical protein